VSAGLKWFIVIGSVVLVVLGVILL